MRRLKPFAKRSRPIPPMRKARWPGSRSLGEATRPVRCRKAYVARLFDDYAPRFDEHLTKNLGYRAPALIAEALSAVASDRRFASALDLGCGTGLMGETLRGRIDHLTGVDLSAAMIAKARERGLYDRLVVGDAAAMLDREPPGISDLIVAADALVYVGDLAPLFAAVARALAPDGLFAFSVETCEGDGFKLEPTMRFAHSRSYVETTAREVGLQPLLVQSASTRREAGADAPGLICVFGRRERSARPAHRAPPHDSRHEPAMARSPSLPCNRSRLRRPISHLAMAGAIGLASDRREPAIGELSAPRIAKRPPAGGVTNVLQPQPSHLANLDFGKAPSRPPFPPLDRGIASGGSVGALVAGVGPSVTSRGPLGPSRAGSALLAHGGAPAAGKFDSDPARLANDGVSGSDAERRGDVACALSLESELLEILDCLGGPQHLHGSNRCRCGDPPRGMV